MFRVEYKRTGKIYTVLFVLEKERKPHFLIYLGNMERFLLVDADEFKLYIEKSQEVNMWRDIIRDSRLEIFPGDIIVTLSEEFEVFEVTLTKSKVKYRLKNLRTSSVLETDMEELHRWTYRRRE